MNSNAGQCLVLDSSVIIALAEINMVNIIEAIGMEIIVPQAVYEEVVVKGRGRPGSGELEDLARQDKVKGFSTAGQSAGRGSPRSSRYGRTYSTRKQ